MNIFPSSHQCFRLSTVNWYHQLSILFRTATTAVLIFAFCKALLVCVNPRTPILRLDNRQIVHQLLEGLAEMQQAHATPVRLAKQFEKLGNAYAENGEYASAINFYQQAVLCLNETTNPKAMREALILLAETNRDAGAYKQAAVIYRRIINADSTHKNHPNMAIDTNSLAMAMYLAGCSGVSQAQRKSYLYESDRLYKDALNIARTISPARRDILLLINNSYAQLLIEENRLVELKGICDVSP